MIERVIAGEAAVARRIDSVLNFFGVKIAVLIFCGAAIFQHRTRVWTWSIYLLAGVIILGITLLDFRLLLVNYPEFKPFTFIKAITDYEYRKLTLDDIRKKFPLPPLKTLLRLGQLGLPLGRWWGMLVGIPLNRDGVQSVVYGSPGSGKSAAFLVPVIKYLNKAKEKIGLIIFDPKGELAELTGIESDRLLILTPTMRARNGKVIGFDPFKFISSSLSQLDLIELIGNIVLTLLPSTGSGEEAFWIRSAQGYLRASFYYYFTRGMDFIDTVKYTLATPGKELIDQIYSAPDPLCQELIGSYVGISDKTLGAIVQQAATSLTLFSYDKQIQQMIRYDHQFRLNDLLEGKVLSLGIPDYRLAYYEGYVNLIIKLITLSLASLPESNPHKVLILCEEAARYREGAKSVIQLMPIIRSRRVSTCLIYQSRSQPLSLDKNLAKIMEDCVDFNLILKVGSGEDAKGFSDMVGSFRHRQYQSKSQDALPTYIDRPYISPQEIRAAEDAIVIWGRSKAGFCRLCKNFYFKYDC